MSNTADTTTSTVGAPSTSSQTAAQSSTPAATAASTRQSDPQPAETAVPSSAAGTGSTQSDPSIASLNALLPGRDPERRDGGGAGPRSILDDLAKAGMGTGGGTSGFGNPSTDAWERLAELRGGKDRPNTANERDSFKPSTLKGDEPGP